jgi:hypothetical protein
LKDDKGTYKDPRLNPVDLAAIYFHPDGKTPARFVCSNVEAQTKLDILMAGLMTVMVIETRKVAVVNEMGALPAYNSVAHWNSTLLEEGRDILNEW